MPVWRTLQWGRSCELLLDDEVGDTPTDSPMPEPEGNDAAHIFDYGYHALTLYKKNAQRVGVYVVVTQLGVNISFIAQDATDLITDIVLSRYQTHVTSRSGCARDVSCVRNAMLHQNSLRT